MTDSQSDGFERLPDRAAAALPTGEIVQIVHNLGSSKTIVEIALSQAPPLHRLFWRPVHQVVYRPILIADGDDLSVENSIGADGPVLFARQVRWKSQGGGFAGSTVALLRVDLVGDPVVKSVDLTGVLPADASVVRLIRVNDTGSRIDVIVSFRRTKAGARVRHTERCICMLDLEVGSLAELDQLPGVWH